MTDIIPPLKVIFLDFDGVIVHSECKKSGNGPYIDIPSISCMTRLKQICDFTGAKIVIHSTWAYVHPAGYLIELLAQYGVGMDYLHDDFMCTHPTHNKVLAIQDWVLKHPNLQTYIILEDELLFDCADPRNSHLVHVPSVWYIGRLHDNQMNQAIKLLTLMS
jgi:hypothetical protein